MSKAVDRNQVLKTTRVRTVLKNDGSWIHRSEQENEEQDKAKTRTESAAESKPFPVKNKSYVFSAAKKFESAESPLNPPPKKTQFTLSEGDSAKQPNVKAFSGETDNNVEAPQKKLDAKTTAENKEAHAVTPPGQSNVESSKLKVSQDAHVKDPVAGTSAVAGTGKNKDPAEDTTKESYKVLPAKQVAAETVEPKAKDVVESSPGTPAVNNATAGGKTALQHNVDPVPDPVSKSPTQSADANVKDPVAGASAVAGTGKNKESSEVAVQAAVELKPEVPSTVTESKSATYLDHAGVKSMAQPARESCKTFPPALIEAEAVKAKAKVVVESSPETPAVKKATAGGKAALQHNVDPVPDPVSKSPSQSADANVKDPVAGASAVAGTGKNKESSEVAAQAAVELKPEVPSTVTEPENTTKECYKVLPAKQIDAETVEVKAKVVVKSSPETPAVNNAMPEGKAALQNNVEPVSDTVSRSPTQSAAETAVRPAECKVKPAAPAEAVVKSRAEEVVQCEAQTGKNNTVKQSMDPAHKNSANHQMELSIKDAVKPVTASEGGPVQDKFPDRAIELTDALDVAPPTTEAVPKPVNDPNQSHPDRSKLNQCDNTNNIENVKKPREELQFTHTLKKTRNGKAVCSFCDQIIDGNVKITLSEPAVTCHSECLKCGVCAKALGDLLTPMFLHDQVIHCNGCFVKVLNT